MTHELQNEFALTPALELLLRPGTWRSFTCPERLLGKHGLGAAGEFVCQSLAHLMGEGGGAG
jgi:hypothetical protein